MQQMMAYHEIKIMVKFYAFVGQMKIKKLNIGQLILKLATWIAKLGNIISDLIAPNCLF